MISEPTILDNMIEGTQKFKKLKLMLKESDQKMENDLSKMEEKLDLALTKIRTLINDIAIQHNEIKSQLTNKDNGGNSGSILGNLMVIGRDIHTLMGIHSSGMLQNWIFPSLGIMEL